MLEKTLENGQSMSLQTRLQKIKTASRGTLPPEKIAIMKRAMEQLEESGILDTALGRNQKAPVFELPDHQDNLISSAHLLDSGPVILTFYRGSW